MNRLPAARPAPMRWVVVLDRPAREWLPRVDWPEAPDLLLSDDTHSFPAHQPDPTGPLARLRRAVRSLLS